MQMKEMERNNRVAMIAHGVINACMLFISVIGFVEHTVSVPVLVVLMLLGIIPVLAEFICWKRDHAAKAIKHLSLIGFALFYTVLLFTAQCNMVYAFVIPMMFAVMPYHDVKAFALINVGTVVENVLVVLLGATQGGFGYLGQDAGFIQISVMILGILIFVDDYFNCLTVGSVMRPVTDKHNVSRAKLAYLIDATAAPICIIAPISSWAAAVSGTVEGVNGISLFISTIPYNLYALLTILMVIFLAVTGFDFGPMRTHELNARNGDLFTTRNKVYEEDAQPAHSRGKVIDLILPVAVLIVLCVLGMIYTGGFFSGTEFVEAFAGCDASYGLSLGSVAALVVIMIYFMCRRVLTFTECMDSVAAGFKQMVPAILILTFAWTLKTMTNHLEAGAFVSGIVKSATAISILLPVILFVVAVGLAFATGTSWGTFGILIPIVTSDFSTELANVAETGEIPQMVIVCISACLAGAVCGDHCSPISDTTIMASTGAQCDHVNHVSTQLPYALTVAGVCIVGYLISGFIQNVFVVLGISIVLMLGLMFLLRAVIGKKQN